MFIQIVQIDLRRIWSILDLNLIFRYKNKFCVTMAWYQTGLVIENVKDLAEKDMNKKVALLLATNVEAGISKTKLSDGSQHLWLR